MLESDFFKRSRPDFRKLEAFGFQCASGNNDNGHIYTYSEELPDGQFRAELSVSEDGGIIGRVIDLETNEEYLPIRVENQIGSFSGTVREMYLEFLATIDRACFVPVHFMFDQANRAEAWISREYGVDVEFPWEKYPGKLVMAGSETDESVYKRFCKPFNGDIDTYFLENQLELKCEDYSFTKMGANINEFGFDVEGNDTIERLDSNLYVIGTAKLTTENAIDGFKGNDVIPAKGESRTIKMRCAFDSFDSTGGPYVFYNLFELLPDK